MDQEVVWWARGFENTNSHFLWAEAAEVEDPFVKCLCCSRRSIRQVLVLYSTYRTIRNVQSGRILPYCNLPVPVPLLSPEHNEFRETFGSIL
jgi:hypothetical protein